MNYQPIDPIRYEPRFERADDLAPRAGLPGAAGSSLGLLRGRMTVLDLEGPLAQGLFARPRLSYRVLMRLSAPASLALKVIGVEGVQLPEGEGVATQDFLLGDRPALGGRVVADAATHILGKTFYSAAPFLYGDYMAKWQVAPISPALLVLKGQPVDDPRWAVAAYFATHGAEWDLRAQLCTDLAAMPIEDARVAWPEELSPFATVARIVVPPQFAWNQASDEVEEQLSFSPWHGLAAHRPLGAVNRALRPALRESVEIEA